MQEKVRAASVPAFVAGTLLVAYCATLAHGVTLWDAGEFLAAIHSLGIPHPPGTPLYVVIGSVWARVFEPLLGFARSVNFLSAFATAAGCALLAACVARWCTSRTAGVAAGLAAGTMLSVWRSATETEVYALSFALALIALALADRAGVRGRWRDAVLAMYVLALAVPVHLSALVVAPGVVALAATDRDGRVHVPKAVVLGAAALLAMALGTMLQALAMASVIVMIVGTLTRFKATSRMRLRDTAALASVVLLAVTAVFVLYLRAQHDPFVNQGNPASIEGMLGVVGREQYDVPPLWPRRAPLWLQVGNLVQYADWQVAFGLDQWVGISAWRTPFTLLFVALAATGAAWHRALDRRSFRAFALALASASLGAVVVLNLRAGPSYGIGVLPLDALHEARERDYFFAIAFALAAAWAGIGATRIGKWLAARVGVRGAAVAVALALAGAPLVLNWRAADRSTDGPPTLAQHFAQSLLDSAPRDAVLLVAGDNDTYPVWYTQRVEQRRRDVTVVTIPLLPAAWYRSELHRRHGLVVASGAESWRGLGAAIEAIGARALELGRPLVVALSVPAHERDALGRKWIVRGIVNERLPSSSAVPLNAVGVRARGDTVEVVPANEARLFVDTVATARVAPVRRARADGTEAYVAAMIDCPARILAAVRNGRGSVDPRCNLR